MELKKAVMGAIGFLFVSLGSSTVELLVSVVKMSTVLEESTTEDKGSVVRFLWGRSIQCNGYS
jgi:hypothetical protein